MRKVFCFLIIFCNGWGLIASSAKVEAQAVAQPLAVVVTFSVIADFVQAVGGTQVAIKTLVGPNGDAHAYEPIPKDSVALCKARLVFKNGLGLDDWVDKLMQAAQSPATCVTLTRSISLRTFPASGTAIPTPDPHVWQDVNRVMQMVEIIREQLSQADASHQQYYQANAARYIQQLQELDQWIVEKIKVLPAAKRKLVTSHDTLGYFADRYGFIISGSALGASTESADPSVAQLTRLIKIVRQERVSALFTENMHNSEIVRNLAKEAGIHIISSLYTDALGAPASDGASYIQMMRTNVTQIIAALK